MLGVSGLSAYLIPYSLGNFKNNKLNNLFLESPSSFDKKRINDFDNQEKKKLEILLPLFEIFSKAVENSKELRDLLNGEMEKFFNSISNEENSLVSIYKKQMEIVATLLKLSQWSFQNKLLRMKEEEKFETAKHRKKLLNQLNSALSSLKTPFEKFIEEIEKQEKENKNSESSRNSTQGGGGSAGEEAKKKLEEVKKNLESSKKEIENFIQKVDKGETEFLIEEKKLELFIFYLDKSILSLEQTISLLKIDIEKLYGKSIWTIERLNNLREKLSKTYKDLLDLRQKILTFVNYEGLIKNDICKNTQNIDKKKCENLPKIK